MSKRFRRIAMGVLIASISYCSSAPRRQRK